MDVGGLQHSNQDAHPPTGTVKGIDDKSLDYFSLLSRGTQGDEVAPMTRVQFDLCRSNAQTHLFPQPHLRNNAALAPGGGGGTIGGTLNGVQQLPKSSIRRASANLWWEGSRRIGPGHAIFGICHGPQAMGSGQQGAHHA
jgi:hypothetical protein